MRMLAARDSPALVDQEESVLLIDIEQLRQLLVVVFDLIILDSSLVPKRYRVVNTRHD